MILLIRLAINADIVIGSNVTPAFTGTVKCDNISCSGNTCGDCTIRGTIFCDDDTSSKNSTMPTRTYSLTFMESFLSRACRTCVPLFLPAAIKPRPTCRRYNSLVRSDINSPASSSGNSCSKSANDVSLHTHQCHRLPHSHRNTDRP